MKNTLIMAGIATGLALAPLGLASAHVKFVPQHGVAKVSIVCNPNFKPRHRVMFMVVAGKYHMTTFKKVRCGTSKTFRF